MWYPRPSSPRTLIADFKTFFGERHPVKWAAGAVAIVMPAVILVGFYTDGKTNIAPKPQLIYVENWRADRSDAEIIAAQKEHQKLREAAQKERQRQFQKLDQDMQKLGI